MFKTILKIAVLSATAITLLSACGAATRALNSAADDALNAALAKAEKRYEKRYTEAISNLTDDNGDLLKVYIDDDGTPFHVTIDENGDPIKVPIDDKINPIKAKTDDKGNPIQVTIDDKGNPTPVTIDDKSDPIQVTIDYKSDPLLTVAADPATAEFCSNEYIYDLWQSPCDNDGGSIKRRDEHCVIYPFNTGCAGDDRYDDARHKYCLNNPLNYYCLEDDRYDSARLEACAVDFRNECAGTPEVEFYSVRIKFCNNPANAGHEACVAPPEEPQVNSAGYTYNHFLQGTADGLNPGNLHASIQDATAPVVHIIKLSDSDDGVAFFGGIAPNTGQAYYDYSFYAGILPENNLGAPITRISGTAVWQGTFSVITSARHQGDIFKTDTDFDLEIDFATKQLSASINGVENKDKNSDLNNTNYSLSGAFADGKIEGDLLTTYFLSKGRSWVAGARVQGLIGQDGAIAAFVGSGARFSGGFIARPSSE